VKMATFRWWTFGTEVVLFELYIPPITPKHQINLSTGCNEYAKTMNMQNQVNSG